MKRLLALLLLLCLLTGCAAAESATPTREITPDYTDFSAVLSFIEVQQPAALDLGQTKFTLAQLLQLKEALPAGADFRFTFQLSKIWIDSTATLVDLDGQKGKVEAADLELMIALMPNLQRINVFTKSNLNNAVMCPLVDAHPEIFFGWTVKFGRNDKKYQIRSDATAFSTAKGHYKPMFRSDEVEILKYVPGLKAIDVGHNKVTDISWLLNFPDLRILILADNAVTDISPLAQLKNLEYAELFMNEITDLTPLSGLTHLVDLNLSHNEAISDLSALDGLTQLERFWCTYTAVPKEEEQRFESVHPGCETDWVTYSSVGSTWRTHWRYDQFKEMFKSRVWHEFLKPEPKRGK